MCIMQRKIKNINIRYLIKNHVDKNEDFKIKFIVGSKFALHGLCTIMNYIINNLTELCESFLGTTYVAS